MVNTEHHLNRIIKLNILHDASRDLFVFSLYDISVCVTDVYYMADINKSFPCRCIPSSKSPTRH